MKCVQPCLFCLQDIAHSVQQRVKTMSKKVDKLDVVGLLASENGRQCLLHAVCGQEVVEGVLVCFKWVSLTVDGKQEMGIAVHLGLESGKDGCHVVFLKRHMKVKHALLEGLTARVGWVLTIHNEVTPVKSERAFLHHNKGSCKVVCTSEWNQVKMKTGRGPLRVEYFWYPGIRRTQTKLLLVNHLV